MLFSQAIYLPFLFFTFLLWLPLRAVGRKIVLLSASIVFYGSWDLRFLILLAVVWVVVLMVPPAIARSSSEKTKSRLFAAGIGTLLVLLLVFKYFGFFLDSCGPLLRLAGLSVAEGAFRIIVPVGISFYVFQAISYLVDCRRDRLQPSQSLLDTSLYVSFFPLLLAGPIERGAHWMPQIQAHQPFRLANLRDGFERLLLGYVLKVGVADPLAPFCNDVFARVSSAGAGELWAGALAYSVQILADFAGYSLIARGSASLFGYEVVSNFQQPYFSRSFSEFWRRWHISLSTWIWEYLFNPMISACLRLVGRFNLNTVEQEMRVAYPCAAVATMALCGLWHGAGWTYVIWGVVHGVFLSFERLFIFKNRPISMWPRLRRASDGARALVSAFLVFILVALSWVLFRAGDLAEARLYLVRLFTADGWVVQPKGLLTLSVGLVCLLIVESVAYRQRDEWVFRAAGRWRGGAYAAAALFLIMFGGGGGKVPFIYFQF